MRKALDDLPDETRLPLERAIRALPDGNVERLESNPLFYRLRIEGQEQRVIFRQKGRQKRIEVVLLDHRDVVYDRVPKKRRA